MTDTTGSTASSGRRVKFTLLLALLLLCGVVMIGWTQTWFALDIVGHDSGESTPVDGQAAAPASMALALSGLALAAALAIAGRVFRVILGILSTLIGACIALSAWLALADPVLAGRSVITTVTGIAGDESVASLVERTTVTPWPTVSLVMGALIAIVGVLVCVTSARWPAASRKYRTVRSGAADDPNRDSTRDAVDARDDLTHGDDPTR